MLKVSVYSDDDKEIFCRNPLSVTIQMSLDIPCDEAVVIVPYEKYCDGATLKIYDGKDVIFYGIVDEEQIILNKTGRFRKYVSRSLMALFVDNEVCPVELNRPTENYLGEKYISPFGIDFSKGERLYRGTINAEKGTSVYDVLNKYSMGVYGCSPRMESRGYFNFSGGIKDKTVIFSNKKGVNYNSYTEYKNRCNLISKVHIKLNKKGYIFSAENAETDNTKIIRERYIDGTNNSPTPADTADKIIANSNKNYILAEIVCPLRATEYLGYTARIDEFEAENYSFLIKEIKYTFNSRGESTSLILERKL